MKNRYKRKAWYLDDDVLLEGNIDKRGFHPNGGIQCGFGTQELRKKDIGKIVFYSLEEAKKVCGDVKVVSEDSYVQSNLDKKDEEQKFITECFFRARKNNIPFGKL